jgi:GT2 family glycosyltransferase
MYFFTEEAIKKIHERTEKNSFQIHLFDNGSDPETQDKLYGLLKAGLIISLHLDSRNTGCLYNKLVFQAMTETKDDYYVVTDNDIFPPKLEPSWLTHMIAIMNKYPDIAMLTPQFPPINLMGPLYMNEDVVYCEAVGNALKMVRRSLYPQYEQKLATYGDDGQLSAIIRNNGYKVAFCRNIFCLHAGQTENWGYKLEEIHKDPRKCNYNAPLIVQVDPNNYMPLNPGYRI